MNSKLDTVTFSSDEDTDRDIDDLEDQTTGKEGSGDKVKNSKDGKKIEEDQSEKLKRTERKRTLKPFTEELLTSSDGMRRIYNEFPKVCKIRRGSEASDLKKLMTMYKEWAYQLHPGIAFSDVLLACDKMSVGGSSVAGKHLGYLRELERNRFLKEKYGVDLTAQQSSMSVEETNNGNSSDSNANTNNIYDSTEIDNSGFVADELDDNFFANIDETELDKEMKKYDDMELSGLSNVKTPIESQTQEQHYSREEEEEEYIPEEEEQLYEAMYEKQAIEC